MQTVKKAEMNVFRYHCHFSIKLYLKKTANDLNKYLLSFSHSGFIHVTNIVYQLLLTFLARLYADFPDAMSK